MRAGHETDSRPEKRPHRKHCSETPSGAAAASGRLPFVTRVHFIECAGNRAQPRHTTVQETHGLTSCAEWTGVPLSLLLREAGAVQPTRAEVATYWNDPPDKSRVRGNDNTVQPWKVASDGSVMNGLS